MFLRTLLCIINIKTLQFREIIPRRSEDTMLKLNILGNARLIKKNLTKSR